MLHGFISGFQQYLAGAPALAFAAAFLAGVLTSLTPCVYPMIPITAAYIGGRSAGQSPGVSIGRSLSYMLGLSVMFSALGAAAALTGGIFGSWISNPFVNLFIAAVFILLGLSMLDVFMLPLPGFLTNMSAGGESKGYAGAFLVGVISSLVATPCTAPVVLSILTLVATRQNVFYGTALLFVYSIGLGLLLVIAGMFAGAVAAMPKSGRWMIAVKWFFGLVIIVSGGWFLFKAISTLL